MYDRPDTRPLIESALQRAFRDRAEDGAANDDGGSEAMFDDLLDRLSQQEQGERRAD